MADYRPATLNVQITQNDTWKQSFTLTNNGVAINLSSAIVTIKISNTCSGTSLSFTNGSGITISGASSNVINVSKAITLAYGDYQWDLQIVYSDTTTTTYLKGDFTILQDL